MDVSKTGKLEQANNLVSKVSPNLLYSQTDDMDKVKTIYNYLMEKHLGGVSLINNENILLRAIVLKQLSLVDMKIVNVDILIFNGLSVLGVSTLSLDRLQLANLLVNENKDSFDLDTLTKCISQVRSKLPEALRERLTREHEIKIKEVLYNVLPSAEQLAVQEPPTLRKQRAEGFQDFTDLSSPSMIQNSDAPEGIQDDMYGENDSLVYKNIDTVGEVSEFHRLLDSKRSQTSQNDGSKISNLDAGLFMSSDDYSDPNTRAKIDRYLKTDTGDATMFSMEIKTLTSNSTYDEQEKEHIREQLIKAKIKEILLRKDLDHINVDKLEEEDMNAKYIDIEPILMVNPINNKHYYYDNHSRSLKEISADSEMKPITIREVELLLKSKKLSDEEINKTLTYLENDQIGSDDDDYLLGSSSDDSESSEMILEDPLTKKSEDKKEVKNNNIVRNLTIFLVIMVIIIVLIVLLRNFRQSMN
jgi:hypothetical protein